MQNEKKVVVEGLSGLAAALHQQQHVSEEGPLVPTPPFVETRITHNLAEGKAYIKELNTRFTEAVIAGDLPLMQACFRKVEKYAFSPYFLGEFDETTALAAYIESISKTMHEAVYAISRQQSSASKE